MTRNSQHDDVIFFLDRCLGKNIVAQRMRAEGLKVEVHADHFAATEHSPELDDTIWLREVGRRKWIILSKDKRIRRNRIEISALLASGAASFILTAGDVSGEQMADAFIKAIPSIKRMVAKFNRPFIATVTASGNVNMRYTRARLIKKF